jgi:hypothetical protein
MQVTALNRDNAIDARVQFASVMRGDLVVAVEPRSGGGAT